ncbi:uncharacterized protein LOC111697038 [Eurytemora carolleeae]|uniref:uncharacterized protein LOC111697038 n=1 Tax=Eurytemora carolleeae TaxID=1294199 RepID=UPI000C780EA7|nr:uncharacterized protein LOC111697038 [Eurytemora carolleeae]|eukprot:XP_023322673.1 uncharacterized protein LOC111697038 [Eurytemora affinis]
MSGTKTCVVICNHCSNEVQTSQVYQRTFPTIIIDGIKTRVLGSNNQTLQASGEVLDDLNLAPGEVEREKSKTPEEEAQIKAKKQFEEDVRVYIAMGIIVAMAVIITLVKIYVVQNMEPKDPSPTFKPLQQMIKSNYRYNGNGYLPCNGNVPCQPAHLSPERNAERMEGAMS